MIVEAVLRKDLSSSPTSSHRQGGDSMTEMGLPQNGCFIMENPFQMDNFGGTPILGNLHMGICQDSIVTITDWG